MLRVALAPSVRTRQLFREYLVGTVLRYIDDVFSGAGLSKSNVPPEQLPSGERRSLVEEYYAGIDWASQRDIAKVLRAWEHILLDAAVGEHRENLVRALRVDGFVVDEDGRINPPAAFDLAIAKDSLDDPEAFLEYERRILENVTADPELAIGSSKELIEAVCALLLDDAGIAQDTKWTADQVFKKALKTLDLSIDAVSDSKAGADSIRRYSAGCTRS